MKTADTLAERDGGAGWLYTSGSSDELTEREREILSLMAKGHSNQSICRTLIISPRTVESHVRNVFIKLGLDESPDNCRRVLAVLAFLQT
jgi:DNA-binding NarL/FixJ family response regulator